MAGRVLCPPRTCRTGRRCMGRPLAHRAAKQLVQGRSGCAPCRSSSGTSKAPARSRALSPPRKRRTRVGVVARSRVRGAPGRWVEASSPVTWARWPAGDPGSAGRHSSRPADATVVQLDLKDAAQQGPGLVHATLNSGGSRKAIGRRAHRRDAGAQAGWLGHGGVSRAGGHRPRKESVDRRDQGDARGQVAFQADARQARPTLHITAITGHGDHQNQAQGTGPWWSSQPTGGSR